jgi:hypothetical protein
VIDLNLTQQDLAKMIGATRETVSHCLARLLEYGAVRRRRAPITVNVEALQRSSTKPASERRPTSATWWSPSTVASSCTSAATAAGSTAT